MSLSNLQSVWSTPSQPHPRLKQTRGRSFRKGICNFPDRRKDQCVVLSSAEDIHISVYQKFVKNCPIEVINYSLKMNIFDDPLPLSEPR